MFPPKGGISQHYSPRAIITRIPLDYNNNCKHPFGCYVQAHHEPEPTNTQAPRTLDCILLDSFDGPAGGFALLHLATNKKITRRTITEVPITKALITHVETLAKREGITNKLIFLIRHKGKFNSYDYDGSGGCSEPSNRPDRQIEAMQPS